MNVDLLDALRFKFLLAYLVNASPVALLQLRTELQAGPEKFRAYVDQLRKQVEVPL